MPSHLSTSQLAKLKVYQKREPNLTPFPLKSFLRLYLAGGSYTYVNYMEGAKLLAEWLAPIEQPKLKGYKLNAFLNSYDLQQLGYYLFPDIPGKSNRLVAEAAFEIALEDMNHESKITI